LLVPIAGCTSEEQSARRCTDWTLGDDEGQTLEAHLHVRNERPEPVCVHLAFAGEDVAKVPLDPTPEDGPARTDERTKAWAEQRLTVRAAEWTSDRWTTEAVDLVQTPHIVVTVTEDELKLDAKAHAP
jgi:hypothetical protein